MAFIWNQNLNLCAMSGCGDITIYGSHINSSAKLSSHEVRLYSKKNTPTQPEWWRYGERKWWCRDYIFTVTVVQEITSQQQCASWGCGWERRVRPFLKMRVRSRGHRVAWQVLLWRLCSTHTHTHTINHTEKNALQHIHIRTYIAHIHSSQTYTHMWALNVAEQWWQRKHRSIGRRRGVRETSGGKKMGGGEGEKCKMDRTQSV